MMAKVVSLASLRVKFLCPDRMQLIELSLMPGIKCFMCVVLIWVSDFCVDGSESAYEVPQELIFPLSYSKKATNASCLLEGLGEFFEKHVSHLVLKGY